MAEGKHPFPSRTRQLSSPASMIVCGQLHAKVERCRIKKAKALIRKYQGFCHLWGIDFHYVCFVFVGDVLLRVPCIVFVLVSNVLVDADL